MDKNKKNNKVKKERKQWVKVTLTIVKSLVLFGLLVGFLGGGLAFGMVVASLQDVPELNRDLLENPSMPTKVVDKNGQLIGEAYDHRRIRLTIDEIPEDLINAFLATEDRKFYDHPGFDTRGLGRAAVSNVKGDTISGGSTITQQLAKQVFLTQEKKMDRKIKEFYLALQIEKMYTKDEILEFYLNNAVHYVEPDHGVGAAARGIFGKSVDELTLGEMAVLAGVPNLPYRYDPRIDIEAAEMRRNHVLSRMYRFGYITQEEYEEAKAEEIVLRSHREEQAIPSIKFHGPYAYAIKSAEQILIDLYEYDPSTARSAIRSHGFTITTTIDSNIQASAESIINNHNTPAQSQATATMVDVKTGEIVALVTGKNAHVANNATLRPVESYRPPGSAIKPLYSYAPALEKRMVFPGSVIDDAPVRISIRGQKDYIPENYPGVGYNGLVTAREALARSLNIPAIEATQMVGDQYALDFANNLGLSKYTSEKAGRPANALGSIEATSLEMTSAYAAFANQGVYVEPYFISEIRDRNGKVIYSAEPKSTVVMSEETAFLVSDMLSDVLTSGTGRRARNYFTKTAAAKTGTSNSNLDGWVIGYTPHYSLGVWIGHDQNEKGIRDPQQYTLPIWGQIMAAAHRDIPDTSFRKPNNVTSVSVSTKSGKLPSPLTPSEFIKTDYFIKGYEPKEVCDAFVEVSVCKECGLLASDQTPIHLRETKVMLRHRDYITTTAEWRDGAGRVPKDVNMMAPSKHCNMQHSGSDTSSIPSGLSHELTPNGIRLRWNGPSNVAGFNVYRIDGGDIEKLNRRPITSREFLDNTAKKNSQYTYYVTAVSSDGAESRESNHITVTYTDTVQKIADFNLEEIANAIKIRWNPALHAKQYKIYRSTDQGGTFNEIGSTSGTEFNDTNVTPNTTYFYRIEAVGAEASPTKSIHYKGPTNGNGNNDNSDDNQGDSDSDSNSNSDN